MSSNLLSVQEKVKLLESNVKQADILLDKRYLYFAFSCLGKKAEVQGPNGKKTEGLYFTSNLENGGVVLKNYVEDNANPQRKIPTKVIDKKDFVYMLISDVKDPPIIKPPPSTSPNSKCYPLEEFIKTDEQISKKKKVAQRTLVKQRNRKKNQENRWEHEEVVQATHGALDDLRGHEGWNQFEMNEKKFGITSEWEEGKYTIQVDMNKVDKALLEKAEKIEAEILGQTGEDNRHIKEERGLLDQKEEHDDEEAHYSAVIRTEQHAAPKPKFTNTKRENQDTQKNQHLNVNAQKPAENKNIEPKETKPKEPQKEPAPQTLKPTTLNPNAAPIGLEFSRTRSEELSILFQQNLFKEPSLASKTNLSKNFTEFRPQNAVGEVPKKEDVMTPQPPKTEQKTTPPVKSNSLEIPTQADASKQTSSTGDAEMKSDFSNLDTAALKKFKINLKERDYKKSQLNIRDYWIESWNKKLGYGDPSQFETNWKKQKSKPAPKPAVTTSTSQGSSSSTPTGTPQGSTGASTPTNFPSGSTSTQKTIIKTTDFGKPTSTVSPPYYPTQPVVFQNNPYYPYSNIAPMGGQMGYIDPQGPQFNMNYSTHQPKRPSTNFMGKSKPFTPGQGFGSNMNQSQGLSSNTGTQGANSSNSGTSPSSKQQQQQQP